MMLDGIPTGQFMLALTAWREARGLSVAGMRAVMCVVRNRVLLHGWQGKDYYEACTKRLQFSAISAPRDPQLGLWPNENDTDFNVAVAIAESIIAGGYSDPTNGATLYYSEPIDEVPVWAKDENLKLVIGNTKFYTE